MAKIEVGTFYETIDNIKLNNGKLLSQSLSEIESNLRFMYGEISLYRQKNNLNFDEFEEIEVALNNSLNEIENIK